MCTDVRSPQIYIDIKFSQLSHIACTSCLLWIIHITFQISHEIDSHLVHSAMLELKVYSHLRIH